MKKSLKNKLLQYAPFLILNKKYFKEFSPNQGANNFLSTIIGGGLVGFYLIMTIGNSPNPWKWKENAKEFKKRRSLSGIRNCGSSFLLLKTLTLLYYKYINR